MASLANRDKTWNWLTDDFFSRFSDHAGMVMIATRWHVDDPIGRWLARFGGDTKVLRYPAIAEHDEPHRKKGVPLFAEHKSLDFLMERSKLYTDAAWEALYQQAPYVVGGGAIPIEKLKVLQTMINRKDVMHSVRYVDKAGSETEDSAYTACVLMHKMKDGTFVIEHVARGHWSALEREQKIKTLASVDSKVCASYELVIEQRAWSDLGRGFSAGSQRLADTAEADQSRRYGHRQERASGTCHRLNRQGHVASTED